MMVHGQDDLFVPQESVAALADRLTNQRGISIDYLRKEKNIVFMIAPERFDGLRRAGFKGDLGPRAVATHVMKAVFRSSVRVGKGNKERVAESRTDTYFLEFMLLEVQTREEKWVDHVEFKRAASGLLID